MIYVMRGRHLRKYDHKENQRKKDEFGVTWVFTYNEDLTGG